MPGCKEGRRECGKKESKKQARNEGRQREGERQSEREARASSHRRHDATRDADDRCPFLESEMLIMQAFTLKMAENGRDPGPQPSFRLQNKTRSARSLATPPPDPRRSPQPPLRSPENASRKRASGGFFMGFEGYRGKKGKLGER